METILKRAEFIKKIIRVMMAGVLALIALVLGGRAVTDNDCSHCQHKGICSGEEDCIRFIKK